MDVTAKQKILLNKLKKKVKLLQRKEAKARNQMRTALKKVSKLSQSYKIKLARKMREMEHKLAKTQAACYAKVAVDLENQLVKGIKRKVKALTSAARRVKYPRNHGRTNRSS